PGPPGPHPGGTRAVRPGGVVRQRPRAVPRGVRRRPPGAAGQLPPGAVAPVAHRGRGRPGRAVRARLGGRPARLWCRPAPGPDRGTTSVRRRPHRPPRRATMTIDSVRTRHYRLTCRRCQRTWTATYLVGTFTDDAGDHEVYFRDGASATAPGSTRCPHCGGLRGGVRPGRA